MKKIFYSDNWAKNLEELIKSNQLSKALSVIENIETSELSDYDLALWASFCRRLGIADKALKILSIKMKPVVEERGHVSSDIILEYGAILLSQNLLFEAQRWLWSIDSQMQPRVLLYRGFWCMNTWQYTEGINYFEKFMNQTKPDSYWFTLSKLNRLWALVFQQKWEESTLEWESLFVEVKKNKHTLLESYLWLIGIEINYGLKNYKKSQECLDFGLKLFKDTTIATVERLCFLKWQAILLLKLQRPEAKELIIEVRALAAKLNHFETLRDLDYHLSILKDDRKLALKLYFGTPYVEFRERLLNYWQFTKVELESYQWGEGPILLDLTNGKTMSDVGFRVGSVPERLLKALLHDFYKPPCLKTLFDKVFIGYYYNAVTAPGLIHQSLFRLRRLIAQANLPLNIIEENGRYEIVATAAVSLKLSLKESSLELTKINTDIMAVETCSIKLNCMSKMEAFSALNLAENLKVSKRTAQGFIQKSLKLGLVKKTGSGPQSRYQRVL